MGSGGGAGEGGGGLGKGMSCMGGLNFRTVGQGRPSSFNHGPATSIQSSALR